MELNYLKGVYIHSYGTLSAQYIDVASDLNVIYGLNGSGKSRILDCIKKTAQKDSKLGINSFEGTRFWHENAALVFSIPDKSNNWEFDATNRLWENPEPLEYPYSSNLPNKQQILDLIWWSEIGRRTEAEWDERSFEGAEFNPKKEEFEILKATIDEALLVYVPAPVKNAYQIIYALPINCSSLEVQNDWTKIKDAMKSAYQHLSDTDFEDHPSEIYDQKFAESNIPKDHYLLNAYTLSGNISATKYFDYLEASFDNETWTWTWPLPFIPIVSLGFTKFNPIELITENENQPIEKFIDSIKNFLTVDFDYVTWTFDPDLYTDESQEGLLEIDFYEFANFWATEFSNYLNLIIQKLLPNSPIAKFNLGDSPSAWFSGHYPELEFYKTQETDSKISISWNDLSGAEKRWTEFAIQFSLKTFNFFNTQNALENYINKITEVHLDRIKHRRVYLDNRNTLILLDEPENGLHRRLESSLSKAISELSHLNVKIIISSHSPSFLDLQNAQRHFVEISGYKTIVKTIPNIEISNLEILGLNPSDVLQLSRVFWFVEGEHEVAVFNSIFEKEIQQNQIQLIPFRGVKSLASIADSRLISDFTNSPILITVDNVATQHLQNVWERAIDERKNGNSINSIIHNVSKALSNKDIESRALVELITRILFTDHWDRLSFSSLSKKDIIEYFPSSSFGINQSWDFLKEDFVNSSFRGDFKEFLRQNYKGKISANTLKDATLTLDNIPDDFSRCLNLVIRLSTNDPRFEQYMDSRSV